MAYSSSVKAIIRVREHLDTLVSAKTNFSWRVSNPQKFAYQLREAIKVANEFKDQYPQYAELKSRFTLRVGKQVVTAELKEIMDVEAITFGRLTIANATSAMEVVGAALSHKAPLMHFPNANLEGEELEKVKRWAEVSDYICESTYTNGVVLQRK